MLYLLLASIPFIIDVAIGLLYSTESGLIDTRYIIAFSSGIVISVAFFELLPEADISTNTLYLALGFFIFYIIEKAVMLHSCGEEECEVHVLTPLSAIGMALDNIIDGLGIAIGTLISPYIGIIITAAVVAHEVPQALTSVHILESAGRPRGEVYLILFTAGLAYVLGALTINILPVESYSALIAFVAGVFLYVGAGDLLMEAHRRFNWRVVLSVLIGAVLPFILGMIE